VTDPYNQIGRHGENRARRNTVPGNGEGEPHAAPRRAKEARQSNSAGAVLDQAVFDLVTGGKAYFDPYAGFYRLDISTSATTTCC